MNAVQILRDATAKRIPVAAINRQKKEQKTRLESIWFPEVPSWFKFEMKLLIFLTSS